jgi:hypothetical protein
MFNTRLKTEFTDEHQAWDVIQPFLAKGNYEGGSNNKKELRPVDNSRNVC